jgi:two-component system sensor histidine kinase PhoQ
VAALDREVERMDQRVSYQLRRARASGATGLGIEPVRVAPMLDDIVATLDKVYRDKQVSCELDVDAGAEFRGDPGDLSEILGNLLDNAYKYCRRRVVVEVGMRDGRLRLEVGDDGPGLPAEALDAVLERGARADESIPGQGIGLAVVRETVELYGGRLELGSGPGGGMQVRVELGRFALGA